LTKSSCTLRLLGFTVKTNFVPQD